MTAESPAPQIRVVRDPEELAAAAAEEVRSRVRGVVAERGEARVVLAGGSTPLGLYRALAVAGPDWRRVRLFWSDERCVPAAHSESNYRAVHEALLSRLETPPAGVHRIRGETTPQTAVAEYESRLTRALDEEGILFDLAILGMGADGHTASLFPGGVELESRAWVAWSRSPLPPRDRITLTLAALNASRHVLFLAAGTAKAEAFAAATRTAEPLSPAARVRPRGSLLWIVDRQTAAPR